ncbi:FK506-binding protein 1 [Blyttiomyces sp. JEL0837]|nr:FK506-binding protein 1 [Blyttiomyces sp. JEL0837]
MTIRRMMMKGGSRVNLATAATTRLVPLLTTPSRSFHPSSYCQGVTKEVLKNGDGKTFPRKGDTVTMHYTGTLTSNGSKFDSSLDRGKPFVTKIGVGQVIRGWDEGVPTMTLGEKAKLFISYDYAYGEGGYPPIIPARADLTFEVELLKIN